VAGFGRSTVPKIGLGSPVTPEADHGVHGVSVGALGGLQVGDDLTEGLGLRAALVVMSVVRGRSVHQAVARSAAIRSAPRRR